jgi:hypothetical protein
MTPKQTIVRWLTAHTEKQRLAIRRYRRCATTDYAGRVHARRGGTGYRLRFPCKSSNNLQGMVAALLSRS